MGQGACLYPILAATLSGHAVLPCFHLYLIHPDPLVEFTKRLWTELLYQPRPHDQLPTPFSFHCYLAFHPPAGLRQAAADGAPYQFARIGLPPLSPFTLSPFNRASPRSSRQSFSSNSLARPAAAPTPSAPSGPTPSAPPPPHLPRPPPPAAGPWGAWVAGGWGAAAAAGVARAVT